MGCLGCLGFRVRVRGYGVGLMGCVNTEKPRTAPKPLKWNNREKRALVISRVNRSYHLAFRSRPLDLPRIDGLSIQFAGFSRQLSFLWRAN